ncbi:MAG: cofactor-independent phosphoglycerate mutase [Lachnospiraceae bacterium]|nr:cofactor-independent phosphoglycerate mutase [Lachnospiraceae bacterium]
MKYIVILGDGMADEPVRELGGRTPLSAAKTPYMDKLSKKAQIGMVNTIPQGMAPGSDTANLAVLGYDPVRYYSGRSPLEALSIGVSMKETDIALRCNIVSLTEEEDAAFEEQLILDHSSDEIETKDSAVLLDAVRKELEKDGFSFYVGTSYRHCMIWENGRTPDLTPPHDVLGQRIGKWLPKEEVLAQMMKKSYEILKEHPLNLERKKQGLKPANCCWFWGAGTKPALTSFKDNYGKKGIMISAVDLLKGIAVGTGMDIAHVEGANGGLNTNYEGKMEAAYTALTEKGYDFAYIHLEGPDEMGHQGSLEKKIKAIEYLDQRIVGPLYEKLTQKQTAFKMLILPDHPTPIAKRTHTSREVPYLLYDSTNELKKDWDYNEAEAILSGNFIPEGYKLMGEFLK